MKIKIMWLLTAVLETRRNLSQKMNAFSATN